MAYWRLDLVVSGQLCWVLTSYLIFINNQEGYQAKDLDIYLYVHVRLIEH